MYTYCIPLFYFTFMSMETCFSSHKKFCLKLFCNMLLSGRLLFNELILIGQIVESLQIYKDWIF